MDDEGNLILQTAGGEVVQRAPDIYQEIEGVREAIPGGYVLEGKHHVGFQGAAYDANKPLVIDPVLVYSTFLGGDGTDRGRGIAVDSSGNAYVTGRTDSANFPTASPLQAAFGGGNEDSFVVKLNAAGSALVYSTYLGGGGTDQTRGIAVDSSGNAYVTGRTDSTNFPTASPLQAAISGSFDAFITKLNASGNVLVYSSYLGGAGADRGRGIAVDSSGNAYVIGDTSSTNFPTVSPFQAVFGGGNEDSFVAKVNPAGSALVYSTYLGGSGEDGGFGIAVDSSGSAYVTGDTDSTNFPTASPLQAAFAGGDQDAFVTKLNASGNAPVYSTYLGGDRADQGRGIAVDSSGNAYVTVEIDSPNFPRPIPSRLLTAAALETP